MSVLRIVCSVIAAILAFAPLRLPAPVVEEEASPSNQTKSRPLPKAPQPVKPKPASQSTASFAGTWTGTATGRINQAVVGQRDFSSNYNLEISADERAASWTSSAWMFSKFHAPVQKNGRTLTWTCERHDFAGHTAIICKLEMTGEGVARYSESSGLVNGAFKGAGYELSGTLVRR